MKFLVNTTLTDLSYSAAPANFLEVAIGDYFIFSQGSVNVADGQSIPTEEELNQALLIIPNSGSIIIPKIFIADISAGIIKEIKLQSANARYVFCVSFDAQTGTEPVFEVWDASGNTYTSQILGLGTPNNSYVRGVLTNLGLPGVNWLGTPLAGDLSANHLLLNNGLGRLLVATDLYFNLKASINSTFNTQLETPKMYIKFYAIP